MKRCSMQIAAAPTCVRLQHVNALHLQQQVHRIRLCKPECKGVVTLQSLTQWLSEGPSCTAPPPNLAMPQPRPLACIVRHVVRHDLLH